MKRFLISFFVAIMMLACLSVSAANGDDIGDIYSTDILAYVKGKPVESFNIGGRTVVIAEELNNYGFYHSYNDETRTLNIESYFYELGNDVKLAEVKRGQVGRIVGDVYETDIKVFFNGVEIKGYNIGGKTAVCLEDMGDLTDSPNLEYGYSKYLGKYVWNEQDKTLSFDVFNRNDNKIMGKLARVSYSFIDNVLYAYPDEWSKWLEIRPVNENPAFSDLTESIDNNYSEGFIKETISPLYIDVAGEKTQVGLAVVNPNNEFDTLMHFFDTKEALTLTSKAKTPQKSYDEAISYFTEKYEIVTRLDDYGYTVLHINDEKDGVLFVYINKNGGFVIDDFFRDYGDREIKVWLEENTATKTGAAVLHSVYPFGGPHGVTTMQYVSELELFDYE